MCQKFALFAGSARLRAPLLAVALLILAGCDRDELLSPDSDALNEPGGEITQVEDPSLASSRFAGGVPIGLFHLPRSQYGRRYNGALLTPGPGGLLRELAGIKARGGKVALNLAGSQKYFKDRRGHFSFSKWKAQVNRFRKINFSSYIKDGTIIGHYLIDEPYDKANFRGKAIGGATIEAMGKYSKRLWPNMVTIVRAEPYKIKWKGRYRYVDAAWAQYLLRKGDVRKYVRENVSDARKMGLGLVVGLNIPYGGTRNRAMSPSQVESYGTELLNSGYACAFISWKHGNYLNSRGMQLAMDRLRRKAQNRGSKSCRGPRGGGGDNDDD